MPSTRQTSAAKTFRMDPNRTPTQLTWRTVPEGACHGGNMRAGCESTYQAPNPSRNPRARCSGLHVSCRLGAPRTAAANNSERIPIKSDGLQFFHAFVRQVRLGLALFSHPFCETRVVWILLRDATVSLALPEQFQRFEPQFPLGVTGRPLKANSYESSHLLGRKLSCLVADAKSNNPAS